MMILRFCACFLLLLGVACGKQKEMAAAPVPETNAAAVAPNESAAVAPGIATNEPPVVTNTIVQETAPVAGQEAYERGLALLRQAQGRGDLEAGTTLFREAA